MYLLFRTLLFLVCQLHYEIKVWRNVCISSNRHRHHHVCMCLPQEQMRYNVRFKCFTIGFCCRHYSVVPRPSLKCNGAVLHRDGSPKTPILYIKWDTAETKVCLPLCFSSLVTSSCTFVSVLKVSAIGSDSKEKIFYPDSYLFVHIEFIFLSSYFLNLCLYSLFTFYSSISTILV